MGERVAPNKVGGERRGKCASEGGSMRDTSSTCVSSSMWKLSSGSPHSSKTASGLSIPSGQSSPSLSCVSSTYIHHHHRRSFRSRVVIALIGLLLIRANHACFRREGWNWRTREDWRFSRLGDQHGKHLFFLAVISWHVLLVGITRPI